MKTWGGGGAGPLMIRAYEKESASYDTVYIDLKCPYGSFSLHIKFVN